MTTTEKTQTSYCTFIIILLGMGLLASAGCESLKESTSGNTHSTPFNMQPLVTSTEVTLACTVKPYPADPFKGIEGGSFIIGPKIARRGIIPKGHNALEQNLLEVNFIALGGGRWGAIWLTIDSKNPDTASLVWQHLGRHQSIREMRDMDRNIYPALPIDNSHCYFNIPLTRVRQASKNKLDFNILFYCRDDEIDHTIPSFYLTGFLSKLNPANTPSAVTETVWQVAKVNREFRFIMINVGAIHSVKKGDTFTVISKTNGQAVGLLTVTSVRQEFSIGRVQNKEFDKIKPGDKIVQKP